MAGIAGIARVGKQEEVSRMLERIAHRGAAGSKVIESQQATLGAVWPEVQEGIVPRALSSQAVWDAAFPPIPDPIALDRETRPFALAASLADDLWLARDAIGVRPLYYGRTEEGDLCFASEVKALQEVSQDIHEFPPGTVYQASSGFEPFAAIELQEAGEETAEATAAGLRMRLEEAVCRRISEGVTGSWLSGGLDSSAIVALVRPHVDELDTFAGGLAGAPDLMYAEQVAEYLDCQHHVIHLTEENLIAALPEVIYALESFDALLVRSTIVNYLVAQEARQWVGAVFSGEGGDELFAGYAYLEQTPLEEIPGELVDITRRLHNTALQRVDRSASAQGLVPLVPFLDRDVVDYVLRIPAAYKRGPQEKPAEKWILRKALEEDLPEHILWRRKAKFWEGAGVGEILASHAERQISDQDFERERRLPNGWELNTKEELLYYRLFREHFGDLENLEWMGRTKGAPRQAAPAANGRAGAERGTL